MSYRRRGAYAPAGPRLDSVAPNSLPVTTVPPFELILSGSFNADGEYEVSIVSSTGQWTYSPSSSGEGTVVAADDSVVATFAVPPDADEPGLGYVQIKDVATGEFSAGVPFSWTASARGRGARIRPAPLGARAKKS